MRQTDRKGQRKKIFGGLEGKPLPRSEAIRVQYNNVLVPIGVHEYRKTL